MKKMATVGGAWLSNMLSVKSASGLVFTLAFASILAACGGKPSPGGSSSGGSPAVSLLALFAGNPDGYGNSDGTGPAARFTTATAIAVDGAGNTYVADSDDHTIRKISAAGVVTTLAGTNGTCANNDGTGSSAGFCNPKAVALDDAGNVYIADNRNHTIRKITPAGVVTTLAGMAGVSGSTDGTGSTARFNYPQGIAVDHAGTVYVADQYNHTIRKITPAGEVTTLAGMADAPGSADDTGSAARFNYPQGVVLDAAANLYVTDTSNRTIRKITPTGIVTTLAGTAGNSGSADGNGAEASFTNPWGITIDKGTSTIYVTDQSGIRKIAANGMVTTLADTGTNSAGTAAHAGIPQGIAVDSAGTLYLAENVVIRKIATTGLVTTLAGAAPIAGREDGMGSAARFSEPRGTTVDRSGNVYVADYGNSTIRKIAPTGLTSTFADLAAGSGTSSTATSGASGYVAVDGAGNVYATTGSNNTIVKITPNGAISTLAGTPGKSGIVDATGAEARFSWPGGIAVDGAGNVYVADSGNHAVRMITPAGKTTTLAGLATEAASIDGIGTAARFNSPLGIAVDNAGNVFVGDWADHTIRKIAPTGAVTTLAGAAGKIGSADGTGANARFHGPDGVAVDELGNVYVADSGNHTIRKITPAGVVTTVVGQAGMASFTPGALPGLLTFPIGVAVGGGSLYLTTNNAVAKVSKVP
jgi:hypothetical protein